MMWQCVVALVILKRELGALRWSVLRERLWLNLPRDPHTGRARARLFWWVVPCVAFSLTVGIVLARYVDAPRSEEHTSELQSRQYLVCRLLLEKKKSRPRQVMTLCVSRQPP